MFHIYKNHIIEISFIEQIIEISKQKDRVTNPLSQMKLPAASGRGISVRIIKDTPQGAGNYTRKRLKRSILDKKRGETTR